MLSILALTATSFAANPPWWHDLDNLQDSLRDTEVSERIDTLEFESRLRTPSDDYTLQANIDNGIGDCFSGDLPDGVTMFPIYPYSYEEDHWLAVTFEPEIYPFNLERITYALDQSYANTDATQTHTVAIAISNSTTPDSSPDIVASIDRTVSAGTNLTRTYWELDIALQVEDGELVHVLIQMPYNQTTGAFPIAACYGDGISSATNHWSNADTTPYSWTSFPAMALPQAALVKLSGYYVLEL